MLILGLMVIFVEEDTIILPEGLLVQEELHPPHRVSVWGVSSPWPEPFQDSGEIFVCHKIWCSCIPGFVPLTWKEVVDGGISMVPRNCPPTRGPLRHCRSWQVGITYLYMDCGAAGVQCVLESPQFLHFFCDFQLKFDEVRTDFILFSQKRMDCHQDTSISFLL